MLSHFNINNIVIIKKLKDIIAGKSTLKHKRSPQWQTVRKHHLKKYPKCALCEGETKIEVHHIKPFHKYPEIELEPTNLITLCESYSYGICCHRTVGHLGDYKKINPDVVNDASTWNNKLKG